MKISYDAKVDAVYIKLLPGAHSVETRHVDDDIALNLDADGRLVGIEVLAASNRLDLRYLFPDQTLARNDWDRLRLELVRRKAARIPVETQQRGYKNWIEDVGETYVVLRRDRGKGRTIKITQRQLEGASDRPYILRALRDLGSVA